MSKRLSAISVFGVLLLSGCAASYPPLYTPPAPVAANPPTNLNQILRDAYQAQVDYAGYYRETARATDLSQLPLIAAAAAAAAVVYDAPSDALDILAGIGIGAGAYTATRSTLMPTRLPELYLLGHSAMSCVRAEGSTFNGTAAATRRETLDTAMGDVVREADEGRQLYETSQLSAGATDVDKRAFQLAMARLNDAIIASGQAYANASRQILAFDNAESTFGLAVASVQNRVATMARTGRVLDFASLRQNISGNIQAAGTPTPPAGTSQAEGLVGAITDAQIISDVQGAGTELILANQRLTSATPDYAASLARVTACPNIVQ